jgi:hypothetical protein
MVIIDRSVIDEMTYRSFQVQLSRGVYTFINKESQEGILVKDDPDNECVVIESFAFLFGEQVIGEASAEGTVRAVLYLEGALGLSDYECGTQNDNTPVPVRNNDTSYTVGDIEQVAIDKHPGTIAALLMLQNTPDELVLSRKGQGGKMLSYVEGAVMTQMANYAFLFNWSVKGVSIREDDKEFSAIVECEFVFTEGYTVTKTQVGSANKKYSKTLKNADKTPQVIMIGDTIKSAITDGTKKCMSALGICQDVYSGAHKAKGLK